MKRGPKFREDVRNLTLIGAAAGVALVGTLAVVAVRVSADVAREVRVEVLREVSEPTLRIGAGELTVSPRPLLFGTVLTRDGEAHTGFLRWDRNEASWTDLLDANKLTVAGSVAQSGIRFGHLRGVRVNGDDGAVLLLKSGEEVEMLARSTDLGSGLRALTITGPGGESVELRWGDLEAVEFLPAPEDLSPHAGRLHGTLHTRSGGSYTGYVTWDVDEILTSDVLDGELDGREVEIAFGAIASIARASSLAAQVTLHDGRSFRLRGSNDVDESIRGIAVSDPALGQVSVDWDEFESVEFHPPEAEVAFAELTGGAGLVGTLVTRDGHELRGEILWDRDEGRSWEILNGNFRGAEFQVEFGNIARIERSGRGARVQLMDGRSFELEGSNDVDDSNKGILIRTGAGEEIRVSWDEFRELRMGW